MSFTENVLATHDAKKTWNKQTSLQRLYRKNRFTELNQNFSSLKQN